MQRYLTLIIGWIVYAGMPGVAQAQTDLSRSPLSIGVNSLFLGRFGSEGHAAGAAAPNGFSIQEVEARISSNIDPYWYGEVTFALHPEHSHGDEDEETGHGGHVLDLEEAFVETLQLRHVQLRVGKFYAAIGKHNILHVHAFPFIDAPLAHQNILGEEGFNEIGFSFAYLLPTPWYLELIAQGFSARNSEFFATGTQDDLVGMYQVRSLWDLSAQTTWELNFGFGHGGQPAGGWAELYSAGATLKWRPLQRGSTTSFSWTAEALEARQRHGAQTLNMSGLSSWVQYQFATRWWLQGRGEYFESADAEDETGRKYSALIGYSLTEFSALRLQYDDISGGHRHLHDHGAHDSSEREQRVTLQLNISMGAHPAHIH